MEELRAKLIESGEKLNAYQNGMEKLANYADDLSGEIANLNTVLERAKKENKLREISKKIEGSSENSVKNRFWFAPALKK